MHFHFLYLSLFGFVKFTVYELIIFRINMDLENSYLKCPNSILGSLFLIQLFVLLLKFFIFIYISNCSRVLSDKKRMENAAGGQGRIRDIETEELIEDQQQRIR